MKEEAGGNPGQDKKVGKDWGRGRKWKPVEKRLCQAEECYILYWPTSGKQRYCPDCQAQVDIKKEDDAKRLSNERRAIKLWAAQRRETDTESLQLLFAAGREINRIVEKYATTLDGFDRPAFAQVKKCILRIEELLEKK